MSTCWLCTPPPASSARVVTEACTPPPSFGFPRAGGSPPLVARGAVCTSATVCTNYTSSGGGDVNGGCTTSFLSDLKLVSMASCISFLCPRGNPSDTMSSPVSSDKTCTVETHSFFRSVTDFLFSPTSAHQSSKTKCALSPVTASTSCWPFFVAPSSASTECCLVIICAVYNIVLK